MKVAVPASELDRAQGEAGDGVGQLRFYNRVSGFDPTGASGKENYGGEGEPGYCQLGPSSTMESECAKIGEGRSNNVLGPVPITLKKKSYGGWDHRKDVVNVAAGPWVALTDGLPGYNRAGVPSR